jgi:hypothetical protein
MKRIKPDVVEWQVSPVSISGKRRRLSARHARSIVGVASLMRKGSEVRGRAPTFGVPHNLDDSIPGASTP